MANESLMKNLETNGTASSTGSLPAIGETQEARTFKTPGGGDVSMPAVLPDGRTAEDVQRAVTHPQSEEERSKEAVFEKMRALAKTPEEIAQEKADAAQAIEAKMQKDIDDGRTMEGPGGTPVKPEEPADLTLKTTVSERFAITKGARGAGYSAEEISGISAASRRLSMGQGTAADMQAVMRLRDDIESRAEQKINYRGSGTQRVPFEARTRYTTGGREASDVLSNTITKAVDEASRSVGENIREMKFESSAEFAKYIEDTTSLPSEVVIEQLKAKELAKFNQESGRKTFSLEDARGRSAEYPILAMLSNLSAKEQSDAEIEARLKLKEGELAQEARDHGIDPDNRIAYMQMYPDGKYTQGRVEYFNSELEAGRISGSVVGGDITGSDPEEKDPARVGDFRMSEQAITRTVNTAVSENSGLSPREQEGKAIDALLKANPRASKEQVMRASEKQRAEAFGRSVEAVQARSIAAMSEDIKYNDLVAGTKSEAANLENMRRLFRMEGENYIDQATFIQRFVDEMGYDSDIAEAIENDKFKGSDEISEMRADISAAYEAARKSVSDEFKMNKNLNEHAGEVHYSLGQVMTNDGQLFQMGGIVTGGWMESENNSIPVIGGDREEVQKVIALVNDPNTPDSIKSRIRELASDSYSQIYVSLPGKNFENVQSVDGVKLGNAMAEFKRTRVDSAFDAFPDEVRAGMLYAENRTHDAMAVGAPALAKIYTGAAAKKIDDDSISIRGDVAGKIYDDKGQLKSQNEVVDGLFKALNNYGLFGIQVVGVEDQFVAGAPKNLSKQVIEELVFNARTPESQAIMWALANGGTDNPDKQRLLDGAISGLFAVVVTAELDRAETALGAIAYAMPEFVAPEAPIGPMSPVGRLSIPGVQDPSGYEAWVSGADQDKIYSDMDFAISNYPVHGGTEKTAEWKIADIKSIAANVRDAYNNAMTPSAKSDVSEKFLIPLERVHTQLRVSKSNLTEAQAIVPEWLDLAESEVAGVIQDITGETARLEWREEAWQRARPTIGSGVPTQWSQL